MPRVRRQCRHWPAFADTALALRRLKQHYRLIILSNVDRASFARSNRRLGVDFDSWSRPRTSARTNPTRPIRGPVRRPGDDRRRTRRAAARGPVAVPRPRSRRSASACPRCGSTAAPGAPAPAPPGRSMSRSPSATRRWRRSPTRPSERTRERANQPSPGAFVTFLPKGTHSTTCRRCGAHGQGSSGERAVGHGRSRVHGAPVNDVAAERARRQNATSPPATGSSPASAGVTTARGTSAPATPSTSTRSGCCAHGVAFAPATAGDLVLVGPDGVATTSTGEAAAINPAAYFIHAPIHRARSDVVAAAHTHTGYGSPFSAMARPLRATSQEACAFHGQQAVFDGEELDVSTSNRRQAGRRARSAPPAGHGQPRSADGVRHRGSGDRVLRARRARRRGGGQGRSGGARRLRFRRRDRPAHRRPPVERRRGLRPPLPQPPPERRWR